MPRKYVKVFRSRKNLELFKKFYGLNVSLESIAKYFACNYTSLYYRIEELGLEKRGQGKHVSWKADIPTLRRIASGENPQKVRSEVAPDYYHSQRFYEEPEKPHSYEEYVLKAGYKKLINNAWGKHAIK